jgi:hypothetical protein
MTPLPLMLLLSAPPAEVPPDTAATAAPEVTAPSTRPEHGASFRIGVGATYARMFTVPMYGGELSLGLGGRFGRLPGYIYLGLTLERMETERGLDVYGAHFTPDLEWKFGVLRLGVVGRVGFLTVQRITEPSSMLANASIGVAGRASVDFFTQGTNTLYLAAEIRADSYFDPIVISPNLSLGYRWDGNSRL